MVAKREKMHANRNMQSKADVQPLKFCAGSTTARGGYIAVRDERFG